MPSSREAQLSVPGALICTREMLARFIYRDLPVRNRCCLRPTAASPFEPIDLSSSLVLGVSLLVRADAVKRICVGGRALREEGKEGR